MGVCKAALGLLGRPSVGLLEALSKVLFALALGCLGREGIIGKIQRRVKAPGAFAEEEGMEVRWPPALPPASTLLHLPHLLHHLLCLLHPSSPCFSVCWCF